MCTVAAERAFDLLDAISQSGAIPLTDASMHVVVASTHCFVKSVIGCVIKDNVNVIENVERSNLLMASTVHKVGFDQLINNSGNVHL